MSCTLTTNLTMIADGFLTCKSSRTPWYFWEPTNPTSTAILFSVVLMVLSHQTAALVFDLSLGLKRRKEGTSQHIGLMVLTWKSSPLAVLNSVFSKDGLARRYCDMDISKRTGIIREKGFLDGGTMVILLVLLFVTPFLDFGTLVLLLEKKDPLTFKEAGFEGLQFGLKENLEPLPVRTESTACVTPVVKLRPQDEIVSKFQICSTFRIEGASDRGDELHMRFYVFGGSAVFINIMAHETRVTRRVGAALINERSSYRLPANISIPAARRLTAEMFDLLSATCTNLERNNTRINEKDEDFNILEWVTAKCVFSQEISEQKDRLNQHLSEVAKNMLSRVTFIPADKLMFSPVRPSEHGTVELPNMMDGNDIIFITRRRRNVGLAVLGIATAIIIVVRLLFSLLLYNDVFYAIDLVIKKRLQLDGSSTLLQQNMLIRFRNKQQDGERVHYGLYRDDLPQVEEIEGGVLG